MRLAVVLGAKVRNAVAGRSALAVMQFRGVVFEQLSGLDGGRFGRKLTLLPDSERQRQRQQQQQQQSKSR